MKNLIAIALFGLCAFANQASAEVQQSCYRASDHWVSDRSKPMDIMDGEFTYRVHPNGKVEGVLHDHVVWTLSTTPDNGWVRAVRGITYNVFGPKVVASVVFAYGSNDVNNAKLAYLGQTRLPSDRVVVSLERNQLLCKGLTPLPKE